MAFVFTYGRGLFAHLFVHIPQAVEKAWKVRDDASSEARSSTDVEERVESRKRLQNAVFVCVDRTRNPH